jgi:hypothetical protein
MVASTANRISGFKSNPTNGSTNLPESAANIIQGITSPELLAQSRNIEVKQNSGDIPDDLRDELVNAGVRSSIISGLYVIEVNQIYRVMKNRYVRKWQHDRKNPDSIPVPEISAQPITVTEQVVPVESKLSILEAKADGIDNLMREILVKMSALHR